MDQSRSRDSAVKPPLKSPLVERSDLQSPQQRRLYGALTLAFWVFWFYLWLPILAFLAWVLGIQQAYKYMVVLGGYHEVIRVVWLYGLVILGMGGGLLLWAGYNIIRFRGVERRTHALPITAAEIGRDFDQSPAAVAGWQLEQRLYVTHDEAGRIARVDVLSNDEYPGLATVEN